MRDIETNRLVWLSAIAAICQIGCSGGNSDDPDSGEDTDTDSANDSDTDPAGSCDSIEWGNPEYFLANGSTAAHWKQAVWFDNNDNGSIDPEEMTDAEMDLENLCKSEKESLVLLMGSDE